MVTDDCMFVFTHPDGRRINAAGQIGRGFVGNLNQPSLFDLNRQRGLDIDAQTSRCRWQGERMDYGLATEYLYAADYASQPGRARQDPPMLEVVR